MKLNRKLMAVVALVALVVTAGIAYAQVTALSTDMYGRLFGNGPAPTLSSCGTAPAVAGTDTAGTITIGTGTPAACTVTFARAYPAAPACLATDQVTNTANPIRVVSTTTAAVMTLAAASVNGDRIDYVCVGR